MSKTIQNGSFKDPLGVAVASGTLVLELSQDAKETAGGQVAPTKVEVALDATGDVDGVVTILANDELEPSGTLYRATVLDSNGARVYGPQDWSLSGASPIDLDAMVPTISQVSAVNPVVSGRLINTTGPLTGGGDLSADRTIAISPAVAAKGDLYTGSAADAFSKLTLGTNEKSLIADSSQAGGVRWGRLNNVAATVAPGVTNDGTEGYEVGSLWMDTTADKAYVLLDFTTGAAVWTEITQAGGGGGNAYIARVTPTVDIADPVDGDFGWANQLSTVKTVNSDGGINLTVAARGSFSVSLRTKAVPADPYTVDIGMSMLLYGNGLGAMGVGFREDATGKMLICYVRHSGTIQVIRMTSFSAIGATLKNESFHPGGFPCYWFRLEDDSTNLKFHMSVDGRNWLEIYSETRTSSFTTEPDKVGVVISPDSTFSSNSLTYFHWLEA